MIHISKGILECEGTSMELEIELRLIMKSLYEKKVVTKDHLKVMVETVDWSDEKMKAEAKKSVENIEKMIGIMDAIVNGKDIDLEEFKRIMNEDRGF